MRSETERGQSWNHSRWRTGHPVSSSAFVQWDVRSDGAAGTPTVWPVNRSAPPGLRVLRVHGGKPKYFHALVGGNFRIDELQAAILRVKLKHLDAWTEARRRNAAYYSAAFEKAGLAPRIVTPRTPVRGRHIFNQYVIRAERRDALRSALAEREIGTEIYYPVPLHLQQCFAYLGYTNGDFPESERAAAETLALPIYPELSEAQLAAVVGGVAGFYG